MKASSVGSRLLLLALACLGAAVLAACGSDSSDDASGGSGGSTTKTTEASGGGSANVDGEALWAKGGSGECGSTENFVDYVCGKPGEADASKPPVKIGWVNNQGGSIVSLGPQATDAAQMAVDWVNKYGGGIGGRKLELVPCYVKNSEEEGKACADKFLADKDIHMISYGSVGPERTRSTRRSRARASRSSRASRSTRRTRRATSTSSCSRPRPSTTTRGARSAATS